MTTFAQTARTAVALGGIVAAFLTIAPANAGTIGQPLNHSNEFVALTGQGAVRGMEKSHTVTVKLLTTESAIVDLEVEGANGEEGDGGEITAVSAEVTRQGKLYTFTISALDNAKSVNIQVDGGPHWFNSADLALTANTSELSITLVPVDNIP